MELFLWNFYANTRQQAEHCNRFSAISVPALAQHNQQENVATTTIPGAVQCDANACLDLVRGIPCLRPAACRAPTETAGPHTRRSTSVAMDH
jgi:hypothetical protein